MQAFNYVVPRSIREVVSLLEQHGDRARILAGGTDIIVQLREGRRKADLVVDIKDVPDVNELSYNSDQGLHFGAAVPCWRIYEDRVLAKTYPGLIDAVSLIGGIQIQGRATVGGNLCNASPAADTIPSLIVLRTICTIAGPGGTRNVPVEEFCTAPGQTVLQRGEFLVSFEIPSPTKNSGSSYLRFIPRNEMDIAVVGVGSSVVLNDDRTKFVSGRIALGAVAPTPLFVRDAGDALSGNEVSDTVVHMAAKIAQAAARPISDMRGTAEQRRHLVGVLTRRAIEGAIQRAKES